MTIEKITTERGFSLLTFSDLYGTVGTVQKSSLATTDAIWLGVKELKAEVSVHDATKMGLDISKAVNGWVPYELPPEVIAHQRLHLNQEQVAELIPILQKFVDTGEL